MSPFGAEFVADAVGPIVVKEVRQGLRARVFAICFGLLLAACLVVALVAATEADQRLGSTLGPKYLTLFLCGLGTVCFLVIPYTAYRSMSREREDETWVLLLYSSAGAPFMVFSYFLNGVDLPTLGLVVAFAASWAFFLTCLAVALGTEGRSRLGRGALHFVVIAILAAATVGGISFGANLAEEGTRWFEEQSFQIFAAAFPLVLLSTAVILLEGAAAGLALSSESSVKGVRIAIVCQQLLAIAATYLGVSLSSSPKSGVAAVASLLTSLMLVLIGAFAISERDGAPRVDRDAKTWVTGGALRGWRLILGLLVLDTLAWAALQRLLAGSDPSLRGDHHALATLFAAPLYVGLYLSVAVLVGRLTPLKKWGEPIATRAAFGILVGAAMILCPVVAVVSGERANEVSMNYLNPFFGMINVIDRASRTESIHGVMLLAGGFVLAAPFAWLTLWARDREPNA